LFLEVVTDLVLALRADALQYQVIGGEAAPEVAEDKEKNQRIEEAVGESNAGDIGKEE
jgi:hypothetical protein